jgi:integrase
MPKRRDTKPTAHSGIRSTEGGHVVRVRVRDPRTGQEVDRPRFVPGSLREALRVQAEMRAEVRERGRVTRTKLSDYARSWLARKRTALSVATLDRYAVALEDHIMPTLGAWYVDAITPDACVSWRDEAAARTYGDRRTYGARTINGWLRVLRTVLADACVELRLGPSPASRLRALPEPPAYDDNDPNVLSATELGALLVALRETAPAWYALIALMGLTGLRTSEATALRWSDIDGDVITVRRSAVRGHVRERTKTGAVRRVPLAPVVVDVLREQRAALELRAREESIARGEIVPASEWVFPSDVGTPRYGTTLARPLRRAMVAAGIERRLTPHGLRRTLNDVLRVVASADVQKAITGHSSEAMRQHYAHVRVEERAAAIARVADVVRLERR